jgi:hypothetical protein
LQFVWTDQRALRAGRRAAGRLNDLGVHLPPGSRLLSAITRIDRARTRTLIDIVQDADFAYRLAESHRTVLEFYVISSALDAIPGAWRERLAIAIGGHDVPEEDTSSMPRDAQFELLLVALINLAGFLDVEVSEPDIRVKAGEKWVGIAAKRLTSVSKFRKRLGDATKQIQRQYDSGLEFGLIALNLDAAISSAYRHSGVAYARAEFDRMSRASEEFVQSRPARERIPAIQTFATMFGWQPAGSVMALNLEFLTHSRWTSPESETQRIGGFLRARGAHLQHELFRLLTTV